MVYFFAAVMTCLTLVTSHAAVTTSNLFSHHMVLQHGKPVPVWGTASPGENVTVNFGSQTVATNADSQGDWSVTLAAMAPNATAQNMTVTGSNTVTITDVLIGDVWLCSGQSNMAFPLALCDRQVDIDNADLSGIRAFTVPLVTSDIPMKTVQANWVFCSPSTAGGFSAVAFYYARKIHLEQNIPYTTYDMVLYYNAFGTIYNDSQVDLDYHSDGTVDQTVFINDKDDFVSFNGNEYVEFISGTSSAGAPDGANLGIVSGLSVSNLTVIVVDDSSAHNSLAGFQFVDVSVQ